MLSGGPVVHCSAIANKPSWPFRKYPDPVFTKDREAFPAEDQSIWLQNGRYRAIVKRMKQVGS